jgi:hypothetical protein
MTAHDHDWQPQPGETACYLCACGSTGYRSRTGAIAEHKNKRKTQQQWTAIDRTHDRGDGRVAPLPDLDQTERRNR